MHECVKGRLFYGNAAIMNNKKCTIIKYDKKIFWFSFENHFIWFHLVTFKPFFDVLGYAVMRE